MARFITKLVSDRQTLFPLLIAIVLPPSLAIALAPPLANAQIIPDNTLPGENSVVPPGAETGTLSEVTIDGGAQRDTVLFHSFDDFQINSGQEVQFTNPPLIERIFSRITGGRLSKINGLLGVDGRADLFFLNPHGVIFGPNAELDVRGSFVVTTGDRILFNDDISFSAVNPEAPPLLTITSPVGIQFGANPGTIRVRQSELEVPSGETLALLGGDIRLNNGAQLQSRDGRINLSAIAEPGTVDLNLDAVNPRQMVQLPDGIERASIALRNNSQGQALGNGNGSIVLYADNVTLSNSQLETGIERDSGAEGITGKPIVIDATGTVRLVQGADILNDVQENALGDGGRIVIEAERLVMRDGSQLFTITSSSGSAGNINIKVDQLILENDQIVDNPSSNDSNPPPTQPDIDNSDGDNPPPQTDGDSPPPSPDSDNPDGDNSPPPRPDGDNSPPPRPDGDNPPPPSPDGDNPDGDNSPPPRPDGDNPPPRPDEDNPPPRPDEDNPPPSPDEDNPPPRPDGDNPPPRPDGDNPPPRPDGDNPPPRPDGDNPPPSRSRSIRASSSSSLRNESDTPTNTNDSSPSGRTVISSNARVEATGTTGNIAIDAAEIRLEGGVRIQIRNEADEVTGGNIRITQSSHPLGRADSVQVLLGAQINSETGGRNSTAGNVIIRTTELRLDDLGSIVDDPGGIDSTVQDVAINGQGGDVRINAQTITSRGGRIGTTVQGRGQGGRVILNVDDTILLTGNTVSNDRDDPQFGIGVIASAVRQPMSEDELPESDPDSLDGGGDIIIRARHLILENGAEIEASAQREGIGGDIDIVTTHSVQLLAGATQGKINRIATQLNEGDGQGGTINIETEQLRLERGSQISAATLGQGGSGAIGIRARDLVITGTFEQTETETPRPNRSESPASNNNSRNSPPPEMDDNGNDNPTNVLDVGVSGIFTNSNQGASGDAGPININASNVDVSDRAQITASVATAGETGNINVEADNLTLDNGTISAEAVEGDGGNIDLIVQNNLLLLNGGEITARASNVATGGNINIDPILVLLSDGAEITASNTSGEETTDPINGGTIDLETTFLVSIDAPNALTATAIAGNGGTIDLTSISNYGDLDVDVSSKFGFDGEFNDNSLNLDPTRSLLELPSAFSDANNQVRNACAPGERGRGSFAVTGRSGLPASPLSRSSRPIVIPDLGPFGQTMPTHTGQLQEAHTWEIAANGAVSLTPQASIDDLLHQGRRAYGAADYQGAIALWTQATEQLSGQSSANSDVAVVLASTFSNLALAYHHIGAWSQAEQALTASESLFSVDQLSEPLTSAPILAQRLNTKAQLSLAAGDTRGAIATWQQADAAYLQAQNPVGQIQTRLHRVQALNTLGFYDQAQTELTQVNMALDGPANASTQEGAIAHLNHGILLQQNGNLEEARQAFQESLALAQTLDSSAPLKATLTSTVLLNLGHVDYAQAQSPSLSSARAYGKWGDALQHYKRAIATASTPMDQLQAKLSAIELLQQQQRRTIQRNSQLASNPQAPLWQRQATRAVPDPFTVLSDEILSQNPETNRDGGNSNGGNAIGLLQIAQVLPLHRQSLYTQLRLAHLLMQSNHLDTSTSGVTPDQLLTFLEQIGQNARQLGDRHTLSYALGYQGQLYAQAQQWQQTIAVTDLALNLSQQKQASEMTYQWYWQLGQAYKAQGKRGNAIGAYTEAVKTLKVVRADLTSTNADVQFSFRDSVEPLYRQLVQLLLQADENGQPIPTGQVSTLPKPTLEVARSLIEDLQLAELQDYFQDACLPPSSKIDTVDPKAAVIYPILLGDEFSEQASQRLDVIISMDGDYIHYSQSVSSTDIQQTVNQLLGTLTTPFDSQLAINTQNLQKLHNWILAPAAQRLQDFQPDTLVFVADGPLRTLPLAALHDGQQYLIEKYNVALSPGLDLLKPEALDNEGVGVFVGGISEAHAGFSALPFVEQEVDTITAQIPDNEVLLNEQLTTTNLASGLVDSPAEILHLATHGKFGADATSTFLLMWDQQLTINDFGALLQQRNQTALTPIELLILSACETATGDSRAVLGIAGMAVKSGVSSAIAGLWPLHDQATSLFMDEFYKALAQPGTTKVEAFRQAQLALFQDPRFQAPYYWSPFVLVGNWL